MCWCHGWVWTVNDEGEGLEWRVPGLWAYLTWLFARRPKLVGTFWQFV